MFAGIEKDGESVDRRELSSAEFVCSDICITHNHVHAPEKICNEIKMYCSDLFFSLRSSKANFSDKLSDKGTIDWLFEKVGKKNHLMSRLLPPALIHCSYSQINNYV